MRARRRKQELENHRGTEAQRHREERREEKNLGPLRGPIPSLSSLCLCG
jgi:hypothetical protein